MAKTYSVSMNDEQSKFIDSQSRQFSLSKFLRVSLHAYICYVRRLNDDGK